MIVYGFIVKMEWDGVNDERCKVLLLLKSVQLPAAQVNISRVAGHVRSEMLAAVISH